MSNVVGYERFLERKVNNDLNRLLDLLEECNNNNDLLNGLWNNVVYTGLGDGWYSIADFLNYTRPAGSKVDVNELVEYIQNNIEFTANLENEIAGLAVDLLAIKFKMMGIEYED